MKRHLVLSKYLVDLKTVKNVSYESLATYKNITVADRTSPHYDSYMLSWGLPVYGSKNHLIETGFFWDAIHIDTLGLYKSSSLNTVLGWKAVEAFTAPRSAADIVLNGTLNPSKYPQGREEFEWDGVVLAAQNPHDRSIYSTGSTRDYYRFIKGACEHYRDRLFIKLHPHSSGEGVTETITYHAKTNGCRVSKTNHSVIKNCAFVLTWNSTFAVDCFLREVPVAQFAPGYWHATPAVVYTAGTYPDKVPRTGLQAGRQLADFLIWRYCFHMHMPIDMWVRLIEHYADSEELFPLPEEFAYANNLQWSQR